MCSVKCYLVVVVVATAAAAAAEAAAAVRLYFSMVHIFQINVVRIVGCAVNTK